MTIVILGWDEAIWNSRGLSIEADTWHPDGPLLPADFARTANGTLAMLLCHVPWARQVPVFWAEATTPTLAAARDDLAKRHHVHLNQIAYLEAASESVPNAPEDIQQRIRQWLSLPSHLDCTAVIWHDSAPDWTPLGGASPPALAQDVAAHLKHWYPDDVRTVLENLPIQMWTAVREALELENAQLSAPAVDQLIGGYDLKVKEWQEARGTIGRLDNTLVDLRKVGFSLITGLLSASAFFGFLGATVSNPPSEARAAVFVVMLLLVAALFSVDVYYQALERGAIGRCLKIELHARPRLLITKSINDNANHTRSVYVSLVLYLVLLATVAGLSIVGIGGLESAVTVTATDWVVWIITAIGLAFVARLVLFSTDAKLNLVKKAAVIELLFTYVVGVILFTSVKDQNAGRVLVAIACGLAVYFVLYWTKVAELTGFD